MRLDRGDLAVEVIVQDVDHGLRRQPVGQRGEAAQIGQPDRGVHALGVAAPDLAAEDLFAGAVADVGIEQRSGDAAQADHLHQPRQRRHDRAQRVELLVGEAARLLGGPARGVRELTR